MEYLIVWEKGCQELSDVWEDVPKRTPDTNRGFKTKDSSSSRESVLIVGPMSAKIVRLALSHAHACGSKLLLS